MNGQQLTTVQQLQVRRAAARHLSGVPGRQNAATIELLETQLLLEEIESRSTPEERARWEREEQSLTERDGSNDRACRDPRDNCPNEGAVLQREWRQKTATITMLTKMVKQQGAASTEMRAVLLELYVALRDSAPKFSTSAFQAFGKAREVLARYDAL